MEMLRRPAAAALLCIAGAAYAAPGQAAQSLTAAPPQSFALYAADAPLAVRPLDDPANPYRGRYSAVDRWIYANAWSHDQLEAFRATSKAWHATHPEATGDDPALRFMAARVDPDGWMKPVELFGTDLEWERQREYVLYDRERDKNWSHPDIFLQRNIFAGTGASDELYREYQMLQLKLDAARTPRIPDWLGSAPPQYTVFVPNGEIVTLGAPGALAQPPAASSAPHTLGGDTARGGDSAQPASLPYTLGGETVRTDARGYTYVPDFNAGHAWQRYSADGALLGESPFTVDDTGPFNGWVPAFYWPQRGQTVKGEDGTCRMRDGRFGLYVLRLEPLPAEQEQLFFNPQTNELEKTLQRPYDAERPVAAFGYDGTPLDLYQPLPEALRVNRTAMQARLADLYAAQQYYGVWWGQAGIQ